jgi:hypothetical protein
VIEHSAAHRTLTVSPRASNEAIVCPVGTRSTYDGFWGDPGWPSGGDVGCVTVTDGGEGVIGVIAGGGAGVTNDITAPLVAPAAFVATNWK